MESQLQQKLRSLCLNTSWKFAVFWKLKHRSRMVLTWEDAYYDGKDKKGFIATVGTTSSRVAYSDDPLELAMAKMSYQEYSLGEGDVGQVAVAGKHSWISSDRHFDDSSSSSEYFDGWQTQFSAGIKTIAVVAVIPHGVVQLGSFDKIAEDLKLVEHIRNVFADLQDSLTAYIPSSIGSNTESSCLSDTCTRIPDSTVNHEDEANLWSQLFSPLPESVNHEISLPSSSENVVKYGNDLGRIPEIITSKPYVDNACPQFHQGFETIDQQPKSSCGEIPISPFSFCAGYELYEALVPPFPKQYEKIGFGSSVEISNEMEICNLLMVNSDTHLLDAVVAKVSQNRVVPQSENSESLLTAESQRTPCSSIDTFSRGAFSSNSSSRGGSELQERVPPKNNKKRAKPGESCRPRPRDRQLIQDRIKELRELVPNGSKCSIDSLLERSIKHMIFLQSVTKHEEKLHKCSASELLDKDIGMRRFSCREQGSSWAVEVGNSQKVYPIIVENINMNGQMLVEMLCEECTMFLEIAETIRSLGLTILKGVSEAYGDKTWVCFVVEGQNNRSMHRMDVLWSLMQLLQPKISN